MPNYNDADLPGGKQFLQLHCYQCDKAVDTWCNDTRINGTILCSTCVHQATRVVCLACGIIHTHIKKENLHLYGKTIEIYPPPDFFDVAAGREEETEEEEKITIPTKEGILEETTMDQYNEDLKTRVEAGDEDKKE